MDPSDQYISLVSSLPSPERLFLAKQPPISRLRLESKLSALEPDHRQLLADIENVTSWAAYSMSDGNDVGQSRVKDLLGKLESGTLKAIINERMDLRATVAALRMKRDGESPPAVPWAISRLIRTIIANWSDPTFKLDNVLPWIKEAAALLERRDPLEMERFILEVTYRQLQRHGSDHHFDFEAVVIYVLKWSIFDRWARSDNHAAADRFERLSNDALSDFNGLTPAGVF